MLRVLPWVTVLALLGAPWVANQVEPRVLGIPFLLAWVIACVICAVLTMALLYAFDPSEREQPYD